MSNSDGGGFFLFIYGSLPPLCLYIPTLFMSKCSSIFTAGPLPYLQDFPVGVQDVHGHLDVFLNALPASLEIPSLQSQVQVVTDVAWFQQTTHTQRKINLIKYDYCIKNDTSVYFFLLIKHEFCNKVK